MLSRLGFTLRIVGHATAQDALAHRNLPILGPTIYVVCLAEPLRFDAVSVLPALLGVHRHPHEHLLVASLADAPPTELLSPILRFAESLEQLDEAEPAPQTRTSASSEEDDDEDLPTNIRPSLVFRSASYPAVPFEDAVPSLGPEELPEVEYDDPVDEGIPTLHDDFESQPTRAIRLTEGMPHEPRTPPSAGGSDTGRTAAPGRTLFYYEALPGQPPEAQDPPPPLATPPIDRTAPYRSVATAPQDEETGTTAPPAETSAPSVSALETSDDSVRRTAPARTASSPYPRPSRSKLPWVVTVGCVGAALGLALIVYFSPRPPDAVQSPVVLASAARDPGFPLGPGIRNAAPAPAPRTRSEATPSATVVPSANDAPAELPTEAPPVAANDALSARSDTPPPRLQGESETTGPSAVREAPEPEEDAPASETSAPLDRSPAFEKAVRMREIIPTERLYVVRPDPAAPAMTWIDALRQCEQEVKGEWEGWRLPYRRELKLLAAIGVVREGTYWSRTRDKTDRRLVYIMDAAQRNLRLVPYDDATATTFCVAPRSAASGS